MGTRIFARFSGLNFIGFALLLLAAGCAETSEKPTAPPTISSTRAVSDTPFSREVQDWPHDISDISPDPRVRYGRLKNGLRYAVLPVQDKNNTISIQLNIAGGFNQEPENAYGVAHLLEHIAFRGKSGDDDATIIHDLQSSGVGFGRDFNGYTQRDNTYYRLNLVSGDEGNLRAAFENVRTLVDLPGLTVENMEAEKRVVLAELKQRDTVQARANQSYLAFSHPRQPRNTVSGIGTIESLAAISLSDLEAFKAAYYVPDQAFLVIAGNVDPQKTKMLIKDNFSNWEKSESRVQGVPASSGQQTEGLEEDVFYAAPKTKRQLNAIERRAPILRPDIFETRRQAVLEQQMIAMLKTRIDQRVEGESAVSWIKLVRERKPDQHLNGVKLAARDLPLAMTIFEEERRRAVDFGFTSQELDYVTATRRAAFKQRTEKLDPYYAWREAKRLRTQFIDGFVATNVDQDLEIFEMTSSELSLEDYNRVARDVWAEFNPRYWTQSSRSMKAVVEDVKAARAAVDETVLTPPEERQDEAFQKAMFDGPGRVESRDVNRREKVKRLLFENGVRLNYKISDKEPDEIKIVISLREPETKHILENQAALAEKVIALSRADIEGIDADRMDRHFVGKRTNFNVRILEDRLVLFASTDPDSLHESLEVLSTFLVKFDRESKDYQNAFEKQIRRTKTTASQSPVMSGRQELTHAYSDRSSVFNSRTFNRPSILSKVDEKIDTIIKTASVQAGVIGDFDAEVLELAFASTLGAMPERPDVKEAGPEVMEDVTLIEPGLTTLTYRGSPDQMALFYCWPDDVLGDAPKYADSVLLSSIFKNRLLSNLRNELGVSYAPEIMYHSNRAFPNLGFVCLFTQIDPKDEMKAHDGFQEIIGQFQNTPITASELDRAREPILSRMKRRTNSNGSYSQYLSVAYSDPDYWTYQKSLSKAVSGVKLKSLNKAAATTYDKSNLHIFRVQRFDRSTAVQEKTLEIKSYLGDEEAQFSLGKRLIYSPEAEKIERGIELMNLAGANGKTEAYIRLGGFHFFKDNLKAAATAYELALPSVDGAYNLGSLYFNNYDVFPDVPDARVIGLLTDSAEGGNWRGQHMLAERLKDGTMTPRDEIGALKWALISNHTKSGELLIEDEKGIARFITGLTEAQISAAQDQAEDWVADNAK